MDRQRLKRSTAHRLSCANQNDQRRLLRGRADDLTNSRDIGTDFELWMSSLVVEARPRYRSRRSCRGASTDRDQCCRVTTEKYFINLAARSVSDSLLTLLLLGTIQPTASILFKQERAESLFSKAASGLTSCCLHYGVDGEKEKLGK